MEKSKSPEYRVLDMLFRMLRDDPTFPQDTLNRLEQARASDKLGEVREVLEACRQAGGENAADIPS